ncbi:MAG: hypothetical protein WCF20_11735 [Methylovirgula sp.]
MYDKHPALIKEIERYPEITIRGIVFVEAVNEDDVVAQALAPYLGKALAEIEAFASKVDDETVLEAGRTIVHEAMCGRQDSSVQISVAIAGRGRTQFQVARKSVLRSQEAYDFHF